MPMPRPWCSSATSNAISADRAVAHEPRHPGGARVALDVGDEDVVIGVDAGERRQLRVGQPRLRAAEAPLA